MTLHIKKDLNINSLSASNSNGICSAIARTPDIDHEIQAISVFPDQYRPQAACVRTGRSLVYLCQNNVSEWHVFQIAGYYY
jgi:hypothetical protein